MTQLPDSWHDNWKGLKVAVFGLGKTGFSVADTLIELGAAVRVYAKNAEPQLVDLLSVIGGALVEDDDAAAVADLSAFKPDLVVTSPGFAPSHLLIRWAVGAQLQIWTDIDLAWRLKDAVVPDQKWILVTGTNGKTTVTELTTALLLAAGYRATSCGNIGTPILDVIRDPKGYKWLVVEISSFQLHYLDACEPESSVLLNIADDHLDWHGGLQNYQNAKAKVYRNTRNAAVYNRADDQTIRLLEEAEVVEGCRAIGFTVGIPGRSEVGFVEDILVDRAFLDDRQNSAREIISIGELNGIKSPPPHLLANMAAAAALALSVGVTPAQAHEALQNFRLSPHRIELVGDFGGVRWINDSKATNAHAADASLSSFESIVWILGGLFKGVNPEELLKRHKNRIRGIVVIGKDQSLAREVIGAATPNLPVAYIPDGPEMMKRAVAAAKGFAAPGDTVLLAPAAASMDQFRDYADRGEQFAKSVSELRA